MRRPTAPEETSAGASIPPSRARSKIVIALLAFGALVTAGAVLIAVIAGVYVNGLARTFDSNSHKIPNALPTGRSPATDPSSDSMNILLMGSDSRGSRTTVDGVAASDQRTDTLMLIHVDADRKAVYAMSIMRDLWVPIPGHGTHKINAAFAYGGSALTVQTVEQLLGVQIDHVALIDFAGFKGMTNALGGVDVNVKRGFTARGVTFTTGINHLDGDDALKFVRERYAFEDGDYQRVSNQQLFLQSIFQKLVSKSTLTSPTKISAFISATSDYLSVDDGFDSQAVGKLAFSLRQMQPSALHFFTIPTSGTGSTNDGESIVITNDGAMPALRQALAADEVGDYLKN